MIFTPDFFLEKREHRLQHEVSYCRTGTTTGSFQVVAEVGSRAFIAPAGPCCFDRRVLPLPRAGTLSSSGAASPARLSPPYLPPAHVRPATPTPPLETWRRPAAMWKWTHQSGHCVAAQPKACLPEKKRAGHWREQRAHHFFSSNHTSFQHPDPASAYT